MKPRALDLFCKAGGATKGLQRAGFHVTGVDIERQPRYCGDAFVQADALAPPFDLASFDFVWASPPCQAFTAYRRRPDHVADRPNLIPETRALLCAGQVPWAIENVVGAPLREPVLLCGSAFALDVRRHRLFEVSFPLLTPGCDHGRGARRFKPSTNRSALRRTIEIGSWDEPVKRQQVAMDIDWMELQELSQAIPPAYAEFIGRAALAHLQAEAA